MSDNLYVSETHELPDGLGPMEWNKRVPASPKTFADYVNAVLPMQDFKAEASTSQDYAEIAFPDAEKPMLLVPFSDWHIGSYGTDYRMMIEFMRVVKENDLRVVWIGDMLQMAIKLRGVLEVMDNAMSPDMQMKALEAFANEMAPYTLASTWDNHSVMREENATGFSRYAQIWKERTIYFNHIGHLDLTLGTETYKVALSHHFKGRSENNPTHSQQKYMRFEANDRELVIAGDSHVPGMTKYKEGGMLRTAINCGTLQTNSGYGKRFFSLTENADFPCVVLDPKTHMITPFWTIGEGLTYIGKGA